MTTGSVREGGGRIATDETAQTNSYVYGLDLSGSLQGAGTIGGLLACTVAGGDDPGHCVAGFYAYDANGNVTDLVGTNSTALAHYEYDPFGNPVTVSGPLAAANPFRFSTKYTDGETGLVYYGFRYYSPGMGRWMSRDPIEESDGNNLYVFTQNHLIGSYDFLGFRTTPPRRMAAGCPCAAEDVNKEGSDAALEAWKMTLDAKAPPGSIIAARPEYCGRVCCNRMTKKTGRTGPKMGSWPSKFVRTSRGLVRVFGEGQKSCNVDSTPECNTKGPEWDDAGYYHSHPNSPDFSAQDWQWTINKPGPLFMANNGVVKSLDPWVQERDVPEGTLINAPYGIEESIINPTTGEATSFRRLKIEDLPKE